MHPRTTELLQHLATQRAVLRNAFDETAPASRATCPGSERWSIVGIIEHIALAEQRIASLLNAGLRKALADDALPPLADMGPLLPRIDPKAILDRERKVFAREAIHPQGLDATHAWQALEQATRSVRELILAADGLDTSAIRAPHPAFGELDFSQWIVFLGYHEARHAAQIRATASALAERP
jgi:hypothetical protein